MKLLFSLFLMAPAPAIAAFTADDVGSRGIASLIGSNTDGAETGLFEIAAIVPTALVVVLGVVIACAGMQLVARYIQRASGAGGPDPATGGISFLPAGSLWEGRSADEWASLRMTEDEALALHKKNKAFGFVNPGSMWDKNTDELLRPNTTSGWYRPRVKVLSSTDGDAFVFNARTGETRLIPRDEFLQNYQQSHSTDAPRGAGFRWT